MWTQRIQKTKHDKDEGEMKKKKTRKQIKKYTGEKTENRKLRKIIIEREFNAQ